MQCCFRPCWFSIDSEILHTCLLFYSLQSSKLCNWENNNPNNNLKSCLKSPPSEQMCKIKVVFWFCCSIQRQAESSFHRGQNKGGGSGNNYRLNVIRLECETDMQQLVKGSFFFPSLPALTTVWSKAAKLRGSWLFFFFLILFKCLR